MSPDHLRRLFARETGSSPLVYLNELRVAKARQLLREGRWRVKEVAAQVGIPDEYYFSRLFLKHTGQRPLDYRRSVLMPVQIGDGHHRFEEQLRRDITEVSKPST